MRGRFDYIVVLGGKLREGRPSPLLISRLETALVLYAEGVSRRILVTGGRTSGTRISEAEAMKQYLVGKGIERSAIIKEERAAVTIGNAFFTKLKLNQIGSNYSLVVVTSDFHVPRARFIFRKIFGRKTRIAFVGASSGEAYGRAKEYERLSLQNAIKNLRGINEESSARQMMERLEEIRKRSVTPQMRKKFWY